MKLEFLETDETGEHVIMVVDGRRTIISTQKTVKDILGMPAAHKIVHIVPVQGNHEDHVSEAPKADLQKIEREDIVIFQPVSAGGYTASERADQMADTVKLGVQYRVLSVHADRIEVIDDKSDSPMRINLLPCDVVLFRKTPKVVVQKLDLLEMLADCPMCRDKFNKPELVALTCPKDGEEYTGSCDLCKTQITKPRLRPVQV